jgi:hypothetical protein
VLLSTSEFRENRLSENRRPLFLWEKIKLRVLVYCEAAWQLESKERLAEVCVLRQAGRHCQSCSNVDTPVHIIP